VEYAPEGRRGFIGSWQQVSVGSGFLLGSLSAALLSSTLSREAFISWGWRIPFLLGILVGILGAYLRWRLNDTPKFTEIEQHGEVAKAPLIEAFTKYRREVLTIFGLTLHNTVAYYIPIIYMTSYIVSVAKLAPSSALWIGTTCLLVFVILIPIWGALSDRIGRKPLLLGYIILAYPLFMMASSGSATLALHSRWPPRRNAPPCPAWVLNNATSLRGALANPDRPDSARHWSCGDPDVRPFRASRSPQRPETGPG
jgi:MHS family proline/betaine transporter-like MFS transporter